MKKIVFTHCADLHLGCMPNHLEERYDDFFDSFKELIENSIINESKYLLISGDLFHLKVINSKTLLNVINLLEMANNNDIKVFVIEGNHDKAFFVDENSWLHFLHKKGYITLLSHKIIDGNLIIDSNSIYEDEDIRIIGIGYLGSTTNIYLKDIQKKISKSNKFTILMLHAAINRLCGEDMGDVNIEILSPLKKVVDYVALGHIHTKYEYNDFIYNPGSTENIRIKDGKRSDKKGYYIVKTENKNKEVNFYNSKQRKIYNETIKLDSNLTIDEVEKILITKPYSLKSKSILELTIYGNVSFNPYLINFEEIKKALKEKYDLLYIDINNLINIVNSELVFNNIIDLKAIEEQAIKNYISINYPQITEIETITKEIQDLKNSLIDEKEYDVIINNMIDKGE